MSERFIVRSDHPFLGWVVIDTSRGNEVVGMPFDTLAMAEEAAGECNDAYIMGRRDEFREEQFDPQRDNYDIEWPAGEDYGPDDTEEEERDEPWSDHTDQSGGDSSDQ